MLDVFRESGFGVPSRCEQGLVNVELSIDPTSRFIAAAERRDQAAVAASLRPLVDPRSVAVVGVSRRCNSIGRRVLRALVAAGVAGPIYPVNLNAVELDGLRCYPTLADLPQGVDLAVIAVPAPAVLAVADQCAAAGVKSLPRDVAGRRQARRCDGRQDAVAEWERQRREVFVPLTYRPGDLAEVDFFEVLVDVDGIRRKAWLFLMWTDVLRPRLRLDLRAASKPGDGHDKGGVESRGKAVRQQALVPIPGL
jgi:predicted CoA-binding protein